MKVDTTITKDADKTRNLNLPQFYRDQQQKLDARSLAERDKDGAFRCNVPLRRRVSSKALQGKPRIFMDFYPSSHWMAVKSRRFRHS